MSSAEQTSVDPQSSSRQNSSPGNRDINISNASPEVQLGVLEMLSQFSNGDDVGSVQLSPTSKNTVLPETQDNAANNITNSEFSSNTTSDAGSEADAAIQSERNIETYV